MIQGLIFDLDGTLVATEKLKAISYGKAAAELTQNKIRVEDVVEGFKDVVGHSRHEVAIALMNRFGLEEDSRKRMKEFGMVHPWQAFVHIRLEFYKEMLADPEVIRKNQWPHNIELFHEVKRMGLRTGLATMSHRPQVNRVLEIIELSDAFDFVATRDDVKEGKPDPEIFYLVAKEIGVKPDECLALEDSPTGVQGAINAGMKVIAITTPFTRDLFKKSQILDRKWIVDDMDVVRKALQE
jgi:HAD superfamily hydrolase (TIGR01509 family)